MMTKLKSIETTWFSKFMLSLAFLMSISIFATAQSGKVVGRVFDETGQPAVGVSIVNKSTQMGAVSDFDGKFEIAAKVSDLLKFSYIGYLEKDIVVKDFSPLSLTLELDLESLEEIIVIGYGTQKKSDVSGSVSKVSGEKLAQIPSSSAARAMQGVTPGLDVNYGSGAPGAQPSLQVRGLTSWGSSNAPLVIIDGVPGNINYLNQEDIKSMTVLKDAATAAIYG